MINAHLKRSEVKYLHIECYDLTIEQARLLTNDIVARHQLFGDLCLEATLSYEGENYTAALACLFVLTEASLIDPDFYKLAIEALAQEEDDEVIEKNETFTKTHIRAIEGKQQAIDRLRRMRYSGEADDDSWYCITQK